MIAIFRLSRLVGLIARFRPTSRHRLLVLLLLIGSASALLCGSAGGADAGPGPASERVYEVHKKVCDLPDREDLSTPEAAYAAIHRAYAREGNAAWLR